VLTDPDSPRGRLLSQYVLARITQLDGVDIALFDWDRNNPIYFFALNADEHIYLRYGGRDATGVNAYLDLDSIELALGKGLELHGKYQAGEIEPKPKPEPVYPEDFPLLVERTSGAGRCVECHLVADYRNQHRELDGTMDRRKHLYRSPNIRKIGIDLDIPRGLVVDQAREQAAADGMRAGDRITAVEGTPVYTFGDLQYYYDQVDRDARRVRMTVERDGEPVELTIDLPTLWWVSDLTFRQSSIEPRAYFTSRPLTAAEKAELDLEPDGFAAEVTVVDDVASLLGNHELEKGDLIIAVDGVTRHEYANTPELYIKLERDAGESMTLDVIRDGERFETTLRASEHHSSQLR